MPGNTLTRVSQSRGSASNLVSQTDRAAGSQSENAVSIPSPGDSYQPSFDDSLTPGCSLWDFTSQVNVPKKAVISTSPERFKKKLK